MIEVEFVGGVFDGEKQTLTKDTAPPYIAFSKPIQVYLKKVLLNRWKYELESASIVGKHIKAVYIIKEQTQETKPYDEVFPTLR